MIKEKFVQADYPIKFVDSVIKQFNIVLNENNEDEMIIPENFFEEEKPFLLIEIPYCEENENKSKYFIKKFHLFTKNNFKVAISWKTRKIRSMFKIKDKTLYPACKISWSI